MRQLLGGDQRSPTARNHAHRCSELWRARENLSTPFLRSLKSLKDSATSHTRSCTPSASLYFERFAVHRKAAAMITSSKATPPSTTTPNIESESMFRKRHDLRNIRKLSRVHHSPFPCDTKRRQKRGQRNETKRTFGTKICT